MNKNNEIYLKGNRRIKPSGAFAQSEPLVYTGHVTSDQYSFRKFLLNVTLFCS